MFEPNLDIFNLYQYFFFFKPLKCSLIKFIRNPDTQAKNGQTHPTQDGQSSSPKVREHGDFLAPKIAKKKIRLS